MAIARPISEIIQRDLITKVVLLSGPRQVGKTTAARNISSSHQYLNFDRSEDRKIIREKKWRRDVDFIVFDELHKLNKWKQFIKGIYDTEGTKPGLLVTGSARLEVLRNVGDSLAGRFFHHRLYPFDLAEGTLDLDEHSALDRLLRFGGFPEPYLANDSDFYGRWQRSHLEIIIRQDLIDLEQTRDIASMFQLIDLLRERVGSSVATARLATILGRDPKTIANWLTILEKLYVIFRVTPYSKRLAEVIRKEPKYYFFDIAQIDDAAARLENFVALSLLKELHRREDQFGAAANLFYLRTRTHKEIDFLIEIDRRVCALIEVKSADDTLSPSFFTFGKQFSQAKKIQLVKDLRRELSYPSGVEVKQLAPWLRHISTNIQIRP